MKIELADLSPEAQQALIYDTQKVWIESEQKENSASIKAQQTRNDGRDYTQCQINAFPKDTKEVVISRLQGAIIKAHYEEYNGEDVANLERDFPDGEWAEHDSKQPMRMMGSETDL